MPNPLKYRVYFCLLVLNQPFRASPARLFLGLLSALYALSR
jgi:hypothetical protein